MIRHMLTYLLVLQLLSVSKLTQAQSVTPSEKLLGALKRDPITAPYTFTVKNRDGRLTLSGRVGTKSIHDQAIGTAIQLGVPVVDALVIDTSVMAQVGGYRVTQDTGLNQRYWGTAPSIGAGAYVYPPPLFGRIDDPFYGFEPPIISYPPDWAGMSARRRPEPLGPVALSDPPSQPPTPVDIDTSGAVTPTPIEAAIDPRGVAILSGTVPSAEAKFAAGERLASMPGVTNVINRLVVRETPAPPVPAPPSAEPPPGPPEPAVRIVVPQAESLEDRVKAALVRQPELATSTIRVASHDGVITLSGKLPSIREAMRAYRTAQRTPGVKEVVDRLEFPPPSETTRNPLAVGTTPDDAEPYLTAQIRRQLGDAAHLDRVRMTGTRLEVFGTLNKAGDRDRIEAIIRSIPILRGFKLETTFQTD